jgi:peptidoglycan-N-acetylglucosamine deacetylase
MPSRPVTLAVLAVLAVSATACDGDPGPVVTIATAEAEPAPQPAPIARPPTPGPVPARVTPIDGDPGPPRLRNRMPSRSLARFQAEVARQAARFPGVYIVAGDPDDPRVALTFDSGPDPDITDPILDILRARSVRATFFFLGQTAEANPEGVRRAHLDGHAIGGHAYTHDDQRKIRPAVAWTTQVERTRAILEAATGDVHPLSRPPYGAVHDAHVAYYAARGVRTVNWSVDSFDWDPARSTPEEIVETVMTYVHPGAIVLLHSGEGRTATVQALPALLDRLGAAGYGFATVPELLGEGG